MSVYGIPMKAAQAAAKLLPDHMILAAMEKLG